jgi:hypothetical protein
MSEPEVDVNRQPFNASSGTLELVSRAARDGAADACRSATRAWDATSLFVSRFVYTTCYTLSYGVVFPAMFLAHSIPKNNAAVQGLADGAGAAIRKVDELHSGATEVRKGTGGLSLTPA